MNNMLNAKKNEVMLYLEQFVEGITEKYLKSVDTNWQPADLLPDTASVDTFAQKLKELQQSAKELSYDFWLVLIGDTITEEALPTYESWLAAMDGVDISSPGGWGEWSRKWTAEENRHGDVLNRYLYLSGRVDMRAVEISTQYLIGDGFDIQTGNDPYRAFVYTSFQELATNVSHRRVASLAKQNDNHTLAKICGVIASDEARHAKAYQRFVEKIFEIDPDEMMVAFADMMKKKIVMPAHNLREMGGKVGEAYESFSDAAQRLGVYTSTDYIDILESLNEHWKIATMPDLNEAGEQARDYLMNLPDRFKRVLSRFKQPELDYQFSWVLPRT